MFLSRQVRLPLAAAVLTVLASACGDSPGPTTPDPPPSPVAPAPPPGPAMAEIEMAVDFVAYELFPEKNKFIRFRWRITLTESAGLGAKINYIRQDIWNRDFDQFERREIGLEKVKEMCGTNIVPKNSEWQCEVGFNSSATNFEGFIRVQVGVVDEHHNAITLNFDIPLFLLE